MSVLKALKREHELFDDLLDRLEELCRDEGRGAGSAIRDALETLFPALRQHETVERLVFQSARGRERSVSEPIEEQHQELRRYEEDILAVLMAGKRCTDPSLKVLILSLCRSLREHFRMEEELLWPLAARRITAMAYSSAEPEGWERIRALEAEIAKRNRAMERAAGKEEGL